MIPKNLKEKTDRVLEDFEGEKRKHLGKMATKMLKKDQKLQALKNIVIDDEFLDSF